MPDRATWLRDCLCLLPDGRGGWTPGRRSIRVREALIESLDDPSADVPDPGDMVVEGRGFLAVPGLVNAHTHSPDNLIRGSAPNLPLELWSLHSAAGRERRGPAEIRLAVLLGCVEMLRTGTTTVLDHVRLSPDLEAEGLDAVAAAYLEAGMRAVIAPVVADRPVGETMPLTEEDLAGADVAAYGHRRPLPAAEQLALVEAFAARWHGAQGRLWAAIGPSAPQRCTDALLEGAAALGARRGLILHMHLLETRVQRAMGRGLYGRGTVAHLDEHGLLGPRTNLVHALWLESGDLDRVAASGAAIVHNPVSNTRLGSGRFPLPDALRKGVRVALGTDSALCNDGNNLFETMKWATILPNLTEDEPDDWVQPGTALRLATAGGAEAIGLGGVTGTLAPGMAADITLLRLASPAFAPLIDPVRQLVQSENGAAVDTVMVAGRVLLEGGRCRELDETALWSEAQEAAERRLRDNRATYAAAARLEEPIRRMRRRIALCGCGG